VSDVGQVEQAVGAAALQRDSVQRRGEVQLVQANVKKPVENNAK
jgi:hypothetical protein